ncbi:MAG: hypothetical protein WCN95_03245 [bacterium]
MKAVLARLVVMGFLCLMVLSISVGPAMAGRASKEIQTDAPVYGDFSTNTSYGVPMLLRHSAAGEFKMLYFGENGSVNWGNAFYSNSSWSALTSPAYTQNGATWADQAVWGVAAVSNLISTDASGWTIQAIGDVNGDGVLEAICRSTATIAAYPTTKSQIRVMFFADNGTLRTAQPPPFYQKTPWVIEGMGLFHTNNQVAMGVAANAEQLLLRHSTAGEFKLLQFQTNGSVAWGNAFLTNSSWTGLTDPAFTSIGSTWTNTDVWGVASVAGLISTNPARWTLDAIGDINGDGKKELIVRSIDTLPAAPTTKSQIRVLFFADNGFSLKASQPPPFYQKTPWVIQGCGHFHDVDLTADGVATNADQLLLRHSTAGEYKLLYFQTNGAVAWGSSFLTNSSWTGLSDPAFTSNGSTWTNTDLWGVAAVSTLISTNPADWVSQAIGDVNRDGRDEIILRSTTTVAAAPTTKSQIRVLFFADNGTKLKSDQPPPFYQKTPWVIEGINKK